VTEVSNAPAISNETSKSANSSQDNQGGGGIRQSLRSMGGYAEQMQSLRPVQMRGGGGTGDIHAAAAHGTSGSGGALPHLDRIQQSFGRHDVSGVEAHVGGRAAEATQAMGATAYASDGAVAFGQSPDLFTAAHEAAHVVQQRGGVQLMGGVGKAGDAYERHADAVAEKVVAGQSAEGLLDTMAAGRTSTSTGAIQLKEGKRSLIVGGNISPTSGGSFTIGWAGKKWKYIELSDAKVTVTAKPTSAKELKADHEEKDVEGSLDVAVGDGTKAGADRHDSDPKQEYEATDGVRTPAKAAESHPSAKIIEAKAKKKWAGPAFAEFSGALGADGSLGVGLQAGGEWDNATAKLDLKLFEAGPQSEKDENSVEDDDGGFWKVKVLAATPSFTWKGLWNIDGVNFEVGATAQFTLSPNMAGVAGKVANMAMKTGAGELAKDLVGMPFAFVEGGYETLKAAYLNVLAGKEIDAFATMANNESLKIGRHFVAGVLGNNTGLGSSSGKKWFLNAYALRKKDHPEMTEEQFRAALLSSTAWQEQAQGQIAQQVKLVLFEVWKEAVKDTVHAKDFKKAAIRLFDSEDPPEASGITVPKIVDHDKPKDDGYSDEQIEEMKGEGRAKHGQRAIEMRDQASALGHKLQKLAASHPSVISHHTRGNKFFFAGLAKQKENTHITLYEAAELYVDAIEAYAAGFKVVNQDVEVPERERGY